MNILYIISDHGYGHASRNVPILKELLASGEAVLRIDVVSGVRSEFFRESIDDARVTWHTIQVDVGVDQSDALTIDVETTLTRLDDYFQQFERLAQRVLAAVRAVAVDLVVYDVACVAPYVAAQLNVRSMAISNFEWAWIYANLHDERFAPFIDLHCQYYALTSAVVELPATTPMAAFAHCDERFRVSFTGRVSERERSVVRQLAGFAPRKKYVFAIFGGHNQVQLDAAADSDEWVLVTRDDVDVARLQSEHGVCFVDVVAAADVILTKPGYGTVNELILNRKPALIMSRPGFAEEPYLIELLHAHTVIEEIADMRGLFDKAQRVYAAAQAREPQPPIEHSNAQVASIILEFGQRSVVVAE